MFGPIYFQARAVLSLPAALIKARPIIDGRYMIPPCSYTHQAVSTSIDPMMLFLSTGYQLKHVESGLVNLF